MIIIIIIIFFIYLILKKYDIFESFELNINKKRYEIIASRYNEDIDWLLNEKENLKLYNKGHPIKDFKTIKLPNVGRESDTYLNYIISNYNYLPEICIFTQGNINDHHSGGINYLHKMKEEALKYGKSNPSLITNKNNDIWGENFNVNISENNTKYSKAHNNQRTKKKISFGEWFKKNIKSEFPNKLKIYKYGLFAVSREKILKHKIKYYKKLKKHVNWDSNPAEGHFFERSWYYIFE